MFGFWARLESKSARWAVFGALLLGIAACAGQVPHPTAWQVEQASQRWPGTDARALNAGRSLYVAKCSGCHTLRLPQAYPADRWPAILDKMKKVAKLSDDQHDKILHYILAVKQKENS